MILIAGVPKRQAAPVYLITAHHLCVPDVFGALAVWRFQTKKQRDEIKIIRPKGDDLCPYGRTRVVGEKGFGYRLPRWEARKGRAS